MIQRQNQLAEVRAQLSSPKQLAEFAAALPADLQDVLDGIPGWRDREKD